MSVSKSPYKRAVALCDSICSKVVRLRDARRFAGICPLCNTRPIEVCFHFIPRGNTSVRFEWDNLVGSCGPCNYGEHMNRGKTYSDDKFRAFHIALVGEARVEQLEAQARQQFKKSAAEMADLARQLAAQGEVMLDTRVKFKPIAFPPGTQEIVI